MSELPDDQKYLSPIEASAWLRSRGLRGCSVATLAHWREIKKGPSYYQLGGAGGKINYNIGELEVFIEKSLVNTDRVNQIDEI